MSWFPRVDSPCPYKGNLSDILDGNICRLCKKQVHDLNFMSEPERIALMSGCESDELCVTYRVPRHAALAALAMGASVLATPALAGDEGVSTETVAAADESFDEIIVGGAQIIKRPAMISISPRVSLPRTVVLPYQDEDRQAGRPRAQPLIDKR